MGLIASVLSEHAKPDDLVILSDADEFLDPAALVRLMADPPSHGYRLSYHFLHYSLRWKFYKTFIRPYVFRFGVLKNPSILSREYPTFPAMAGIHCSYCFKIVKAIIHKLETYSHLEFSTGRSIDPAFIVSRVACGIALIGDDLEQIYLAPPNASFLDLPPGADWMFWRVPFMDLPELHLTAQSILAQANCTPDLKIVNGTVHPYA
jgi:hypothetical protein